MYRHPIIQPAFHLSWFLLILGGISLFEKTGWGIPGSIMFITGMAILAFTAMSVYLKKQYIKEPGWMLLLSLALLCVLVLSQVIFQRYALAAVLAVLTVPVILGWVKIRSTKAVTAKKKSAKK